MEIINKVLRVLVYIMLLVLLSLGGIYVLYNFSFGGFKALTDYLGILFISFSLILYIFIKNKRSKNHYNILLIIIGIFIMWRRYMFYVDNPIYLRTTLIKHILSITSLFDIVPLLFIYISVICTYIVCRKQK